MKPMKTGWGSPGTALMVAVGVLTAAAILFGYLLYVAGVLLVVRGDYFDGFFLGFSILLGESLALYIPPSMPGN
jgi:hypothetical protein